jgi:hypothetical protein
MTVFAHAGHILIDLPLYGGPVFLLLGAFAFSTLRARRSGERRDG